MAFVKAGPNQYLLVGRGGQLANRGSAVQAFLWPGSVWVLVPSAKQEAAFEFTQETRDGIPLRFKGIVVYRIADPIVAAAQFDFAADGIARINMMLAHICLGELRHAVAHMTMTECIEQRKTTLTGVVRDALTATISSNSGWGIELEVAQVAQVFIVDDKLRGQLEAEVRDEIRLRSEQSQIKTDEEAKLAAMTSARRVDDQQLESDREGLRRAQELAMARISNERAMAAEQLETERAALALEAERIAAERPVRLQRIAAESEIAREDADRQRLVNAVEALAVEHDLLRRRAEQDLRREILPLEQTPRIVEAAAKVLNGTHLTMYGEGSEILGQVAPLFEILGRAVTAARDQGVGGAPPAEDV